MDTQSREINGCAGKSTEEINKINELIKTQFTNKINKLDSNYDLIDHIKPFVPQPRKALHGTFEENLLFRLPLDLYNDIKNRKNSLKCGMFKELEIVYYIIDKEVCFWDLKDDSVLKLNSGGKNVLDLCLVNPKEGCFSEEIKHVLVLACEDYIGLLPLVREENNALAFGSSKYRIAIENKGNLILASTNNGRIFIGDAYNNISEFVYYKEMSFFHGHCALITKTGYSFPNFRLFTQAETKELISIVVDNKRNILYSLDKDSTIQVFSLGASGNEFHKIQTLSGTLNIAKELLGFTFSPQLERISDIQVISPEHSSSLFLIAFTPAGASVLFKGKGIEKRKNYSLEVYTARVSSQQPLQDRWIGGPNLFHYGITLNVQNLGDKKAKISALFLETASGIDSAQMSEFSYDLETSGPILKVVPCDTVISAPMKNYVHQCPDDSISQYFAGCRTFYFITEYGILELSKLRPVDLLKKELSLVNNFNAVDNVVHLFGKAEISSISLSVKINYPLNNPYNRIFGLLDSSYKTFSAYSLNENLDYLLKQIFNQFIKDSNTILVSPPYNNETTSKDSQFFEGLLKLVCYIILPIWSTRMIQTVSDKTHNSSTILGNSIECLDLVIKNIDNLLELFENISSFKFSNISNKSNITLFSLDENTNINGFNVNMINELVKLVNRIKQILHFYRILHLFGGLEVLNSLPASTIAKYRNINVKELIINEKSQYVYKELFIILFNHHRKLNKDSTISKYSRNYCFELYDTDEFIITEIKEAINLACLNSIPQKKNDFIAKAESCFEELYLPISLPTLSEIIIKLSDEGYKSNAFFLILKNINNILRLRASSQEIWKNYDINSYCKLIEIPFNKWLPVLKENIDLKEKSYEYYEILNVVSSAFNNFQHKEVCDSIFNLFSKNNIFETLLNIQCLEKPLSYLKENESIYHSELLINLYLDQKEFFFAGMERHRLALMDKNLPLISKLNLLKSAYKLMTNPESKNIPKNASVYISMLKSDIEKYKDGTDVSDESSP